MMTKFAPMGFRSNGTKNNAKSDLQLLMNETLEFQPQLKRTQARSSGEIKTLYYSQSIAPTDFRLNVVFRPPVT